MMFVFQIPFYIYPVILQQGSHPVVRLSRVKPKESLNSYKRVRIWSLDELKLVDCHFEGPEVDFKFEKQIFKWVALEVAEKKSFIVTLLKVQMFLFICRAEFDINNCRL